MDVLEHGAILLMCNNLRGGQIILDELQAGFIPLGTPPGRDGLIVNGECMHLPKQATIILITRGVPACLPRLLTFCLYKSSDKELPALTIINNFNKLPA